MNYITVDAGLKTTFIYSRILRVILGGWLIYYGFDYFLLREVSFVIPSAIISLVAVSAGVALIYFSIKGPYLKVNEDNLQFKLHLRDKPHQMAWSEIKSLKFDDRRTHIELPIGTYLAQFNCSKENFGAIKRALRHYGDKKGIAIYEQEY